MTQRKIVAGMVVSVKDEAGAYLPSHLSDPPKPAAEQPPAAMSIDDLLLRGLRAIYGLMRAIELDIATGDPARDTVMNLKDAMAMLKELKKEERELLDSLSDDELQGMLKK